MKITITRAECSKYGQDGVLYINNNPVCDTCEHPERKLPAGEYDLKLASNRKLQRLVPTLSYWEYHHHGERAVSAQQRHYCGQASAARGVAPDIRGV